MPLCRTPRLKYGVLAPLLGNLPVDDLAWVVIEQAIKRMRDSKTIHNVTPKGGSETWLNSLETCQNQGLRSKWRRL
jgi:hypothetical protein